MHFCPSDIWVNRIKKLGRCYFFSIHFGSLKGWQIEPGTLAPKTFYTTRAPHTSQLKVLSLLSAFVDLEWNINFACQTTSRLIASFTLVICGKAGSTVGQHVIFCAKIFLTSLYKKEQIAGWVLRFAPRVFSDRHFPNGDYPNAGSPTFTRSPISALIFY